ncbi:MAG: radical SAM protein [Candidatus Bathyarchaeales archaeon]
MGKCQICHTQSPLISSQLRVCLNCIQTKPEPSLNITDKIHAETRAHFGLPPKPPNDDSGLFCGVCANNCRIGVGKKGYCGLVENKEGKLARYGGTPEKGILSWYYDNLPTNCVAWWFCPGCTGAGYPKYAYTPHAETGYYNVAVFYGSCSLDCLFCQNWHYRKHAAQLQPVVSAQELAEKVDEKTSCICYFGGDPASQMPHSLKTSQLALQKAEENKRVLRVCWETNGYMNPRLADQAAELALKSGGNIKFDLKTWNENLNKALCGTSNQPTLETFKVIGTRYYGKRAELPVLTASTLLIPGYVDREEIEKIAKFIAKINPEIPYTLLAFYPQYVMNDLPTTNRKQATECLETAKRYLTNVRIGNMHLLS